MPKTNKKWEEMDADEKCNQLRSIISDFMDDYNKAVSSIADRIKRLEESSGSDKNKD